MTSENEPIEETEKQIRLIRRVSWDGKQCPDGLDCPARFATNWGKTLIVGRPVTDPEVLRMHKVGDGEVLFETPDELWEDTP